MPRPAVLLLAAWVAGNSPERSADASADDPSPGGPLDPFPRDGSPAPYGLRWTAPPGCPTVAEVVAMIAAYLAPEAGLEETWIEVDARITELEDPRRYGLELATLYDGELERHRIESLDCRALAESVSLFVGASVARKRSFPSPSIPDVVPAPIAASPAAAAPREPSHAAETTGEPPPPAGPRARRAPLSTGTGVHVGVDVGSIEVPAAIVGASVGPAWKRVRLEGVLRFVLPRTVVRGAFEGRFWQWSAAPRGCGRLFAGRTEIVLCGAVEVGQIHGQRRDVVPPRRGSNLWIAPVASLGFVWMGRHGGIRSDLEGGVRLVGSDFDANGGPVLSPWPVSLRLSVGFFFDVHQGFGRARTTMEPP